MLLTITSGPHFKAQMKKEQGCQGNGSSALHIPGGPPTLDEEWDLSSRLWKKNTHKKLFYPISLITLHNERLTYMSHTWPQEIHQCSACAPVSVDATHSLWSVEELVKDKVWESAKQSLEISSASQSVIRRWSSQKFNNSLYVNNRVIIICITQRVLGHTSIRRFDVFSKFFFLKRLTFVHLNSEQCTTWAAGTCTVQ